MRVTDQNLNLNYDLDDNMSAYNSLLSGNGLQSEYNYPDSMCGSANGDFMSNKLVEKARARSPLGMANNAMSPRNNIMNKHSGNLQRMRSNDRRSTTMKVSIDINRNKVVNTLGVKKAMKNYNKMKGLTHRYGNRSFNVGTIDRIKDGSPQRSEGELSDKFCVDIY